MRVVRGWRSCRASRGGAAEALSAFGDGTVFCEPYLETGRHIEVQILADQHGTVWAVGERECSIQRRHQKVVEEAPSPLVERIPAMRAELFDAARDGGARRSGTSAPARSSSSPTRTARFYFLEMNTRLQVEHPVTEATTGLDLVRAAARGRRRRPRCRPSRPPDGRPRDRGPAVRRGPGARLATADRPSAPLRRVAPEKLRPATTISRNAAGAAGAGGLRGGRRVGGVAVHYDPMLAKVIAWAPTGRRRRGGWPRALARAADPRGGHQPGPAGAGPAASGVPGRGHRHRVLRPARDRRCRSIADGRPGSRRSRRRWPMRPRRAARRCSACPAGGATCRRSRSGRRYRRRVTATHEVALPAHPGRAGCRGQRPTLVERRAGAGGAGGRRRAADVRGGARTTGWCVWTRRSGRWR